MTEDYNALEGIGAATAMHEIPAARADDGGDGDDGYARGEGGHSRTRKARAGYCFEPFTAIWRTGAWTRTKRNYDRGLSRQRLGRGEEENGGRPKSSQGCLTSFLREASPLYHISPSSGDTEKVDEFGFAGINFPIYSMSILAHGSVLTVLCTPRCQSRHKGNQCLQSRIYSSRLCR